jgi:hypothetical protein
LEQRDIGQLGQVDCDTERVVEVAKERDRFLIGLLGLFEFALLESQVRETTERMGASRAALRRVR